MADYQVSFPGLGIENLPISRTLFQLGPVSVQWYGFLIGLGVMLGFFLSLRQAPRYGLKSDDMADFYLFSIPIGVVGARIYYVLFDLGAYRHDWKRIFYVWEGGLAFYGGVIAGVLTVWVLARRKKIPFHRVADFFIPYVPLGQAIGRWGNFFNQEAFGTNTKLPWGMYSNGTHDYLAQLADPHLHPEEAVHPTFLYESLANFLIFALLIILRRRCRRPYAVLATYLLGYGIVRFFVERVRTDALFVGNSNLRVSELLSAIMVLFGLGYWLYILLKARKQDERQALEILLAHSADGRDFHLGEVEMGEEEAQRFDEEVRLAKSQQTDSLQLAVRELDKAAEEGEAQQAQERSDKPEEESF